VFCGSSPDAQWIIERSKFGISRTDNSQDFSDREFSRSWEVWGCDKEAPVNQAKLMQEEEELRKHPPDFNCTMKAFQLLIDGKLEESKKVPKWGCDK
jgi:hypothetical protein